MCARGESSFLMLAAYSIYYDIHIYLVDEKKKIYLKFLPCKNQTDTTDTMDTTDKICILYKNPHSKSVKSKYRKKYVSEISELDTLNTYCELVQYDKPLCGQSTYKLHDLEEMANKLSISLLNTEGKSLKKADLYNMIWEKMGWTL
jgi:hypothetical protein